MTATEILLIAGVTLVTSFVGSLGAMLLIRQFDFMKKKRFVDVLIRNIEDQIETEVKFMDIARNFDSDSETKDENDKGETK